MQRLQSTSNTGNEFKLNSSTKNTQNHSLEDNLNAYKISNSFVELGIENHQTFHELYLHYLCEEDN